VVGTGRRAAGPARLGPAWEAAARAHREAVDSFLALAAGIDDERWGRPMAAGKWSPAQVAEHLVLAFEAMLRELAGEGGMRPLGSRWRRALLRWLLLPHILFHRSLPIRARAPREVRPAPVPGERPAALARLGDLARRFEQEVAAAAGRGHPGLTHPYFGRIAPLRALRFSAVHVEHHHRQVERALAAGPGTR
jgi:hypothetical protein